MRKIILVLMTALLLIPSIKSYSAENKTEASPADKLIESFASTKGATAMTLKGLTLGLIKPMLKDTPVRHITDEIHKINLLMFSKTSQEDIMAFEQAAAETFKKYQLIVELTEDGATIIAYIDAIKDNKFSELLLYIKDTEQMFLAIRGDFTLESLEKMATEEE